MKEFVLVSFVFISLDTFSQSLGPQVIANGGSSLSNASGQLEWTLGEPVTAALSAGNTISQGFHQPDLSIATGIITNENDGISAFPNPASDMINVKMDKVSENVVAELYSIEGRLVFTSVISRSTQIQVSELPPGSYLLVIKENNIQTRTFQVIKN